TKRATHAFLTYVAVDDNGDPTPVPPFNPKNEEEKKRYAEAGARRKARLAQARSD
ncbi:acyl-CoA thioesterase, partial [bacterium]|nr:acyl-CoA thioesterase [bacterium]